MDRPTDLFLQSLIVVFVLVLTALDLSASGHLSAPEGLAEVAIGALALAVLGVWTAALGHLLPQAVDPDHFRWWSWLATIAALAVFPVVTKLLGTQDLATAVTGVPSDLVVAAPAGLVSAGLSAVLASRRRRRTLRPGPPADLEVRPV